MDKEVKTRRRGQWMQHLSIQKSFIVYMVVSILACVFLCVITIALFKEMENAIMRKYIPADVVHAVSTIRSQSLFDTDILSIIQYEVKIDDDDIIVEGSNRKASVAITAIEETEFEHVVTSVALGSGESFLCNLLAFLQIISVPTYVSICLALASAQFYKKKLKVPLGILRSSAQKISSNDLDFTIQYESKDEMGVLCSSFEDMRRCVLENNLSLWRTAEERKLQSAAISHDLRTPLTVLRGQADLLQAYLPENKISREKTIETIHTMSSHINRLERYVDGLNQMYRLEDIVPCKSKVVFSTLVDQFRHTADTICNEMGIAIDFHCEFEDDAVCIDAGIVQRVFDNFLSNAICYAKAKIVVTLAQRGSGLILRVEDDGKGLCEDVIKNADRPLWRADTKRNDAHLGLGLYICRVLCERCDGKLLLSNSDLGGACVCAQFFIDEIV